MKITAILILLITSLLPELVFAITKIEGLRIWPTPDHTRIVLDSSEKVKYKVFTLNNPDRLVIDIPNAIGNSNLRKNGIKQSVINKIRYSARNQHDLRIVLDLKQQIKPNSFQLTPNKQYGHRLVIDLYPSAPIRKKLSTAKNLIHKRKIVIVIDAGHGGDDPGAIGVGGIREKTIVLAMAKELSKLFSNHSGFRPALVRSSDYYVGLRKRTAYARKQKADLLISIHADAFKSVKANGASVFAVSKRGATSEAARWLAASENRSDLIGGVGSVSLDDKDDLVAGVLLDLSLTASLKASIAAGKQVVKELGAITRLHKKQVEQAGFVVLKSPDIPSILIETGFISNPREARKLNSRSHQKAIAKAIFNGIKKYFSENPPPGTWLAWQQNQGKNYTNYKVANGDTLSMLAQKNNTSTSYLKQINALSSNQILINQIIKIPAKVKIPVQ